MTFALIGAAGFVAHRHVKSIKDLGLDLVAALDKFDSVGYLDEHFPNVKFFTEFERFDRFLEKLKHDGRQVDYISICTPNYLHDAHIRFGLRYGANIICEKPLVINPWNIAPLRLLQNETGKDINCILQLRLHPSVLSLKQKVEQSPKDKVWDIELTYITARGNWYYTSWKGDVEKSGGIATNIGIHIFDILIWIFGPVVNQTVHISDHDRAAGFMELERAKVRWFLSINQHTLPDSVKTSGKRTFRSLQIEGDKFEFSEGFDNLHTISYQNILAGKGFSIDDSVAAINAVYEIRNSIPLGIGDNAHPLASLPKAKHPFDNR